MNSESCEHIGELLVPYADGELEGDERRRVEAHLAACPACREEVHLLSRSLELAQAIWHGSAAAVEARLAAAGGTAGGVPWPRVRGHAAVSEEHAHASVSMAPRWTTRRWVWTAAASCAAILLAAGLWLLVGSPQHRRTAANGHADASVTQAQPESAAPQAPSTPDEADLETLIAREARAARLAAAIGFLATEPSLKDYKDRAERYLAEAYAGTTFGRQVTAPPIHDSIKEPKS